MRRFLLAFIVFCWTMSALIHLAYGAESVINGYHLNKVSVTSTTVPASVMNVNPKGSYYIKVDNAATACVDCQPYTGSVPGAADANAQKFCAGERLTDGGAITTGAMSSGWACVLDSGATPVTVQSVYRMGN